MAGHLADCDMRILEISEKGDKQTIVHAQDASAIYASNKEERKHSDEAWGRGRDMKKVASVPFALWCLWRSMGITDNPVELMRAIERNPEVKTTDKRVI